MRLWLWLPLCTLAIVVSLVAMAPRRVGFDGVVSAIETRYHAHATQIPMTGLISVMALGATHGGVGDVHVAEFEHFSGPVDGNELNRMVGERLGNAWDRMVRETSRKGREQTLIFSRPEGGRMGLFVVDFDGHELDVVQVSVNPDHLNESIAQYEHHGGKSD
ncbi:MAG TPA: hypothetical protein VGS10_15380 [Terracidiphilus sp.]|nr:hypothetical protein [Terracidiphilus sp.]